MWRAFRVGRNESGRFVSEKRPPEWRAAAGARSRIRTEARSLEGCCATTTPISPASRWPNSGRGDWIRTSDPLVPNQVRYQAALRLDNIQFCTTASVTPSAQAPIEYSQPERPWQAVSASPRAGSRVPRRNGPADHGGSSRSRRASTPVNRCSLRHTARAAG